MPARSLAPFVSCSDLTCWPCSLCFPLGVTEVWLILVAAAELIVIGGFCINKTYLVVLFLTIFLAARCSMVAVE